MENIIKNIIFKNETDFHSVLFKEDYTSKNNESYKLVMICKFKHHKKSEIYEIKDIDELNYFYNSLKQLNDQFGKEKVPGQTGFLEQRIKDNRSWGKKRFIEKTDL